MSFPRSSVLPLAAASLIAAIGLLAGCAPAPPPAGGVPTPDATEAAFAEAEATYRAYLDAVNDERAGGSSDPLDYLAEPARTAEIRGRDLLHAEGLAVRGTTTIEDWTPKEARSNAVEARVCVDSSASYVVNTTGEDVTPASRPTRAIFSVIVERSGQRMLVASMEGVGEAC